jgi:hypothetical protein
MLVFVLSAAALAQGGQAPPKTQQQTEGARLLVPGRLIVPITGTIETATTPAVPSEPPTTPPSTPGTPAAPIGVGVSALLAIPAADAALPPEVTGSFSIRRFARTTNDTIAAVGTLTLSFTDPSSSAARTVVTQVAIPVAKSGDAAPTGGPDTQPIGSASQATATAETQVCETLSLVLGPLQLDLLGNAVQLNQANVDFLVVPGVNRRLGNVLCDVNGLMERSAGPAEVVRMLNTLLDTVG